MRRKLLAVAGGALLTLVLLELTVALAYRGFVHLRADQAPAALQGAENEIRILCAGESTTAVSGDHTGTLLLPATAYPAQLERILNARQSTFDFNVRNAGMLGGNTETVTSMVEITVPELRPHMIIAMMGFRDTAGDHLPLLAAIPDWLSSLRTVQLAGWLYEGVVMRRGEGGAAVRTVDDIPRSMNSMNVELRIYGKETRLVPPLSVEEARAVSTLRVAIYHWYIGRIEHAEALLRGVIAEQALGYNILARVLASADRLAEAEALLEGAICRHPDEGMYWVVLGNLLTEHGRLEEARALLEGALADSHRFRDADYIENWIYLALADVHRARGSYDQALLLLDLIDPTIEWGDIVFVFPAIRGQWMSLRGEIYIELGRWREAESSLRMALAHEPMKHSHMWLLSQVYQRTGQFEKEEGVRRELLRKTRRMGDYFELAQLLRRSGNGKRAPALLRFAVEQIPSIEANYRRLYELASGNDIKLVVMQYPFFSLDLLHQYAPEAEGVEFIDNEHIFDAAPEEYIFDPRYPWAFAHYTEDGARVLAAHVADTVLELFPVAASRFSADR